MDASYITPFIESTRTLFDTMLRTPVSFGTPATATSIPSSVVNDVSGIIGLSGDVIGTVVLSFPRETAVKMVGAFIGSPTDPSSDDFADAVGELVNIVSGGANAKFEGKIVSISCPSVIVGKAHKVAMPGDSVCISIPCESTFGSFAVEVCIKLAADGAATGESAQRSRKSA